jgi:hypothetical protein
MDAEMSELPVTDALTNPNADICVEPDMVPADIVPPFCVDTLLPFKVKEPLTDIEPLTIKLPVIAGASILIIINILFYINIKYFNIISI